MYELETLIVAIIGACFGAIGALYFISKSLYDRYNMPKFRAFYPDGSTELKCRIGEERRICINIENYGRKGATIEKLFYYFPQNFEIKQVVFGGVEYEIKKSDEGAGIFAGYQYVSCARYASSNIYFSPKEKHEVYFDVKFPEKGELNSIFITGFPTNLKTFVLELKLALI